MNRDVPSRVRELFHEALGQPPASRESFLQRACGEDRAIFDEVAQLLAIYRQVEAVEAAAPDAFIGQSVGAYQITRLIGAGGMGRVYLARRADGTFEREVAVKIIDPDSVDDELVARFQEERRILGSLRHPGIAELYDAGHTEDGQLYFVMEYVDGLPITEFCDRHDLSLRDRLSLMLKVCDAVSEAHRHRVIHRDLKPGNILVSAAGSLKLVDFGIAKSVTPSGLEASDATLPFQKRATPAYASPEQMKGDSATTSMDVFALGVILHELLTGQRPWDSETTPGSGNVTKPSRGLAKMLASPVDSTRSAAEKPLAPPPGLRPSDLEGDLDAIVLKALRGDARERYRDVAALASDIRNYLEFRPVSAREYSWPERARKLVQRKPALVALSTAAMIATLIAIGSIVRLWLDADRERARAAAELEAVRTLAKSLFGVDGELAALPGGTDSRRQLAETLRSYLARVEVGRDRGLALDHAESYRRLGDIQGNPNVPNLGEPAKAIVSYRAGLASLEPFASATPEPDIRLSLARLHASLADVLALDRTSTEAREHYAAALQLAEAAQPTATEEVEHRRLLAGLYRSTGDLKLGTGDVAGAMTDFERALALDMANLQRGPEEPGNQRSLALTRFRIASGRLAEGKLADARSGFRETAQALQSAARTNTERAFLQREIAIAEIRLGSSLEAESDRSGRAIIQNAIDTLEAIGKADPHDARARQDVVAGLVALGDSVAPDDTSRAREAYRQARELALGLTAGPAADDARRTVSIIDARLLQLSAGGAASLQLFQTANGRRMPVGAGENAPYARTQIAVSSRATAGWSKYLLVFGANGPARLIDESELRRIGGQLELSGPPPSQTVLLLAVPRPLTEDQRRELLRDLDAMKTERVVDRESQIIWTLQDQTIESRMTARGFWPWVSAVRDRIAKLGTVTLTGRTFPLLDSRLP